MDESALLIYLLIVLIAGYLLKQIFSKDRSSIWSPVTVISLCYIYYCIVPYFTGGSVKYHVDTSSNVLMHFAALLSYICVLIGFSIKTRSNFRRWNNTFSSKNILSSAVLLFVIASAGYSAFRGIHFSIVAEEKEIVDLIHTSFEHYFLELLLLYVAAFALFVFSKKLSTSKKWMYLLMWYILVTCIFAGVRSRIVLLTLASCTVIYLYPIPRRPNYLVLAVLAVALYVGFSIMDRSRMYSQGIRMDLVNEMSVEEMTQGAEENNSVYWFSSLVMDHYAENGQLIYFEPILTAAFMPIPRAVFPWKPSGRYLIDTQILCIGTAEGGAAFLYFVEGYLSFWWFGVILYGLLLGWLSRKFWDNYQRNKESIGACLALALFSAVCYCFISRGYLAAAFELFVYTICLPFWIVRFAGKCLKIFRP